MNNIEFTRFIERYLEDKMQTSERMWFEKELEGNLWLRKELELRRKADQIASNTDAINLRKKLAEAEMRHRKSTTVAGTIKRVGVNYAAIFIGLVIIGTLVLLSARRPSLDDFTGRALSSYTMPTEQRSYSDGVADKLSEGLMLYKQGDFEGAIAQFSLVIASDESQVQPEFYSGMAKMNIENYKGAISSFNNVIGHNDNMFIEDATYYLGLCYYHTSETEKASVIMEGIMASSSRYKKDAKKVMARMNR